jgi:dTDP-4-dehydrorhamnose 3,5-epimerase
VTNADKMPFTFEKTEIPEVIVVTPHLFSDKRGYFFESYKRSEFVAAGIVDEFRQDNGSVSRKNVLRGLHFQNAPYTQAKLVRVTSGRLLDVAVDVRKNSPHFGRHVMVELSAENRKMLYIPVGFAHGFAALEDKTEINYKVTNEYCKEAESGIIWNDVQLNIAWGVENPIITDKDLELLPLNQANIHF